MAADPIILAELKVNTDELVAENDKVIKKLIALKEQQKELKKETANLTTADAKQIRTFTDKERAIKTLTNQYNANNKTIEASKTAVEENTRTLFKEVKTIAEAKTANKDLAAAREKVDTSTKEGEVTLKLINKTIKKNNDFVKSSTSVAKEQEVTLSNVAEKLKEETNSIDEARESNKALLKVRNELNLNTKEGLEARDAINKKIDENNDFIKDNVSALEEQKIGIGSYEESIKGALSSLGPFGAVLTGTHERLKAAAVAAKEQAAALTAMTASTNASSKALKLFRLALISTGVGALVVALGALITFLSTTQRGINFINKGLEAFKAISAALLGEVQQLGETIFDAFANPQEAVRKLWEVIKTSLVVTGVDDLIGKTRRGAQGFTKLISDAAGTGVRIAEIEAELGRTAADFVKRQTELSLAFERQKAIAEDITKTDEQRRVAGERSIAIAREEAAVVKERSDLEVELLNLKASLNDTSDEDRLEIQNKINEALIAEKDATGKVTGEKNKLNALNVAIAQKAINASKSELELFIKNNEYSTKALADQLKIEEEVSARRIEIINEEVAKKLKTTEAAETEKRAIEAESAKKRAELTVQYLNEEVALSNTSLSDELIREGITNDEKYELRRKHLEEIKALELEKLQERRDAEVISERQYNVEKIGIESKFLNDKFTLQKAEEERVRQGQLFDTQLQRQADALDAQEYNSNQFSQELARISQEQADREVLYQSQREKLLISEEQFQQALINIERTAALKKRDISRAALFQQIAGAAQVAGAIGQIAGEQTAVSKAAAIAQSTINTYSAATQALLIPPPAGQIIAGILVAAGLANVAKISRH
ncbi:uncharacterized protein LOC132730213 [Ruditapes philippinarum]|uniref:uncharacterized protein LOC132730213 n=1 Tax=Ruditapes philippinarum TaxID=129788 RepID=UPI00295BFAB4|nr:uncharacterized protein LOC132730213 [Ruditapes philippinarum]